MPPFQLTLRGLATAVHPMAIMTRIGKNIFPAVLLSLVSLAAVAAPARRGVWKALDLVDGTQAWAELRGDEFGHFWASGDGRLFEGVEKSGLFAETSLESVAERAVVARMAEPGRATAPSRSPMRRMTMGGDHDPYVGSKRCLVLLVNFADVKFEADHDNAYYQRLTNEVGFFDTSGNTHSVKDYFLDQSHGLLDIDFDVVGPVELEYGYAHYGGGDVSNAHEMVREGYAWAEAQGTDFSVYDWDGDGEVEQVFVLYAGHGAASWYDQDTVWPHMSSLRGRGGTLTYDGVTINTYACSCELSGLAESGRADGIGSMCHEFSHCMGLPDMYDTGYGGNYGMSYWDIMDLGMYNGSGSSYLPAGYTSYERMYCGWLDPVELTEETTVSGMSGLTDGGGAYVIRNAAAPDEYYLLENRVPTGFDGDIPGSGLLVLHVDFDSSVWSRNLVNTTGYGNDHQRCTMVPSDGDFTSSADGRAGDAWPCKGNRRLDNTSTPAATAWNANSDGSFLMNVSITGIRKADDGTVSFVFYPAGTNPNRGNPPEGNVFYESFDYCTGTGGNDGLFGSSISVGSFEPDNDGWECISSHGCDGCAMFGSNNSAASVLTPAFPVDGEVTFTFMAAPYEAIVPGRLEVSAESGGITLSETGFTIGQGGWTACTLTVAGSGEARLRISETSGLRRFFMDEVSAVPASAGIGAVADGARAAARGVYTLGGVRLGGGPANLRRGVYIIDGEKRTIR